MYKHDSLFFSALSILQPRLWATDWYLQENKLNPSKYAARSKSHTQYIITHLFRRLHLEPTRQVRRPSDRKVCSIRLRPHPGIKGGWRMILQRRRSSHTWSLARTLNFFSWLLPSMENNETKTLHHFWQCKNTNAPNHYITSWPWKNTTMAIHNSSIKANTKHQTHDSRSDNGMQARYLALESFQHCQNPNGIWHQDNNSRLGTCHGGKMNMSQL